MIIDGLYYNFIEHNLTVSQLTRSSFEAYLRESELMASLGLQSSSYTPCTISSNYVMMMI